MITLVVNGEARRCDAGLNLEQALGQLVVESDVLEVVTIVGGGS